MTYWKAVYKDGTELQQYNADGSTNKYSDIDRVKLKHFTLFINGRPHTLSLEDGKRLIYRRRVQKTLGKEEVIIYIVGWQKKVGGENVQSIMYISDNQVLMSGKWGDGLFSAPKFFNFEKIDD